MAGRNAAFAEGGDHAKPGYMVSMYDKQGNGLLHTPDVSSDSLHPVADWNEFLAYTGKKKTAHAYDDETGGFKRKKVATFRLWHMNPDGRVSGHYEEHQA